MWLFGQVWFACLVGFVVGVGLTWLWGVRPANKRAADAELSARRAARPIQQTSRPADDFRPGFGNTSYDAASAGDTAAPSSVGVSTGSGRPGLDEMFEPERSEPANVDTTRVHSVDDYVEALVQEYQGDAPVPDQNWSNRGPEAVESWRPGALGSRLDAGDPSNTDEEQGQSRGGSFDSQLTSYQPVQQQYPDAEPPQRPEEATQVQARPFANNFGAGNEFGSRGNADEQYLDYLRSGAMDSGAEHPVVPEPEPEPEPEAVRDYVAQEPEPEYPAHQQYPAEQYQAEQYQADGYPAEQYTEGQQYPAEQHSEGQQYPAEQYAEGQQYPAEQYTQGQQYPAEDYPAQQYPAHDQYPAGHEAVAEHDGAEQEYEQQEYEQAESQSGQTPAHSSEQAAEVTSVLPLVQDEPADEAEQTVVDQEPVAEQEDEHAVPAQRDYFEPEPLAGLVRPHSHDGGPIASAQPFQLDGPDRVDSGAQQGQLTPIEAGGWQPFAKPFGEEESEQQEWQQDDWSDESTPANGAHGPTEQYDDEQRDPTGPVAAEIIEQADHAGTAAPAGATSLFAPVLEEQDYDEDWEEHADPASSRSLFEPVIEPEQPTGYLSPVAQPVQQNDQQPTRQATAPHPIRVRTGIAQPNRPVRAPAGSAGWQTGPFGPGSALPLPDGSAPSPQFRIKARTSSMVFHTESSPFYDRLEPQVWFSSQEDAQRAGFTSWERPRTW